MNELQMIRRKIQLKRQGRDFIGDEIIDLQIRMALVVHKSRLEAKMNQHFDANLSRKLDAIQFLLEE